MKISLRGWILLVLLAVAGFGIWMKYGYPRFAVADLSVGRQEAVSKASAYLKSLGVDPDKYSRVVVFESDNWADRFLQKTLGFACDDFIIKQKYDLFYWKIRFLKELQKEEYAIRISSKTGQVIAASHLIEDIQARVDLGKELSKEKAKSFLEKQFGLDFSEYDFSEEKAKRLDNRIDYVFLWEKKGLRIPWQIDQGQAKLLVGATVSGEEVREFHGQRLDVPEKFERFIENQLSSGDYLSSFSILFLVGFVIIAIAIIIKQRHILAVRLAKKWYLYLVGLFILVNLIGFINNIQSLLIGYNTSIKMSSFIGIYAVRLLINTVYLSIIFIMPGLAGEALRNETMPHRPYSSFLHYIKSSFFSRSVFISVVIGYLLFFLMLGLQSGVFYLGQKYLGVWREWLRLTGLSSAYFPFFAAFAVGFDASLSEEIVFRLFGITFTKKHLRFTALAVLFTSLVWGLGHSSYAVFPFWFRALEVTLIGIILGWAFLKYGLFAVIVAHYVFDVFWGVSAYILGRSSVYLFVSSLFVLALPLIFGLICYFINAKDQEKEIKLLLSPSQKYNSEVLINFIRAKKSEGKSARELKDELILHNWDIDVVNLAIDQVYKE